MRLRELQHRGADAGQVVAARLQIDDGDGGVAHMLAEGVGRERHLAREQPGRLLMQEWKIAPSACSDRPRTSGSPDVKM